jgi:hypothetical protein
MLVGLNFDFQGIKKAFWGFMIQAAPNSAIETFCELSAAKLTFTKFKI